LDPNFRKLSVEHIVSAYKRTKHRAILLDYDSTMVQPGSISATPSAEAVSILNSLCSDTKNCVFIVSGKERNTLTEWFSSCEKLGLAAEHGYFVKYVIFPCVILLIPNELTLLNLCMKECCGKNKLFSLMEIA
jgi:trehalose 6-phosphate synthase/phosphatase